MLGIDDAIRPDFFHGSVLSGVGRDGRQAACQRVE